MSDGRLTPLQWIKLTRELKEYETSATALKAALKPHGFKDLDRSLDLSLTGAREARKFLKDRRRTWGKCQDDPADLGSVRGCKVEGCTGLEGSGEPQTETEAYES